MRRLYENDVKNRITTVTEFSLTRSGVKKNTYATDYTNTSLIEFDPNSKSVMTEAIGNPVKAIANSMTSSNFAAKVKPIICNANTVMGDLVLTSPTMIEYAAITVYNAYSVDTVMSIWLNSGDNEIMLGSVTFENPDSDLYTIDLNYNVIDASSDNPVTIKAKIEDNTIEDSSSVLSYKYCQPED